MDQRTPSSTIVVLIWSFLISRIFLSNANSLQAEDKEEISARILREEDYRYLNDLVIYYQMVCIPQLPFLLLSTNTSRSSEVRYMGNNMGQHFRDSVSDCWPLYGDSGLSDIIVISGLTVLDFPSKEKR